MCTFKFCAFFLSFFLSIFPSFFLCNLIYNNILSQTIFYLKKKYKTCYIPTKTSLSKQNIKKVFSKQQSCHSNTLNNYLIKQKSTFQQKREELTFQQRTLSCCIRFRWLRHSLINTRHSNACDPFNPCFLL